MLNDPVLAGLSRIDDRLDTVNKSIAEVHGRVTELSAKVERHFGRSEEVHRMVMRHETVIDGNSGDGLRARITVAESKIKALGNPARRAVVAQRTSIVGVITAVGAAIGAAIAAVMGAK